VLCCDAWLGRLPWGAHLALGLNPAGREACTLQALCTAGSAAAGGMASVPECGAHSCVGSGSACAQWPAPAFHLFILYVRRWRLTAISSASTRASTSPLLMSQSRALGPQPAALSLGRTPRRTRSSRRPLAHRPAARYVPSAGCRGGGGEGQREPPQLQSCSTGFYVLETRVHAPEPTRGTHGCKGQAPLSMGGAAKGLQGLHGLEQHSLQGLRACT
jgi:hypothetical protein